MNVHTPERGPDETLADYKVRRRLSKSIARAAHPAQRIMGLYVGAIRPTRDRRALKAMGVRQYKKAVKAGRRSATVLG